MTGSDLDDGALAVARANGARLRLESCGGRPTCWRDCPDAYDAIVANLPYVAREAIAALEPEVARHEPRLALDGGPGGLDVLARADRPGRRAGPRSTR